MAKITEDCEQITNNHRHKQQVLKTRMAERSRQETQLEHLRRKKKQKEGEDRRVQDQIQTMLTDANGGSQVKRPDDIPYLEHGQAATVCPGSCSYMPSATQRDEEQAAKLAELEERQAQLRETEDSMKQVLQPDDCCC